MTKIPKVDAPQSIQKLVDAHLRKKPTSGEAQEAIEHILDAYLVGIDVKEVKVCKGRESYKEIRGYLNEIPYEVIVCVREVLDACAMGISFQRLMNGESWKFLVWVGNRYPILIHARTNAMRLRDNARAEKALDRLEVIADEEEGTARVKANEILLRATHPAFGHTTEAKTSTDRPLITINVGAIYGAAAPQIVENFGKLDAQKGETIDLIED